MPGSSPLEILSAALTDLTAALSSLTAHVPIDNRPALMISTQTATSALQDVISMFHPSLSLPPASPEHTIHPALTAPTVAQRVLPALEQRVAPAVELAVPTMPASALYRPNYLSGWVLTCHTFMNLLLIHSVHVRRYNQNESSDCNIK